MMRSDSMNVWRQGKTLGMMLLLGAGDGIYSRLCTGSNESTQVCVSQCCHHMSAACAGRA